MKKQNYLYLFFPLFVVILYVYQILMIDTRLDSIFDEGYLFLLLQSAHRGIHDGFTQWPAIVNAIFGEKITSNILYLRYARCFVHLLSIILFSIISTWYLIRRGVIDSLKTKIVHISLVFLLGSFTFGGIILSYNILQNFFLTGVICSFLITTIVASKKAIPFLILIGFFFFLSLMTVLPSAILVFGCVVLLIWIKNSTEWRKSLISTLWILLGFFVSALFFHIFILNLFEVYRNIIIISSTLSKWDAGYDPISFVIRIGLYFRDFYMGICLLLGMTMISYFVKKYTNHWIALILFLSSIVIFTIYQKKPEVVITTYLALPVIIAFFAILIETPKITFKTIFSFKVFLSLFLFFLPLISSIGTNVYLGSKMIYFLLPWSILILELINNEKIKKKYYREGQFLIWLILILVVYQPIIAISKSVFARNNESYYFENEKPISEIRLTKEQKVYFENVYGIMKKYGYKSKDVIFATQLDHMTIVAFNAMPCGTFFFPEMFLIEPNKKLLKKPDFLFLNEYDYKLMSDSLKSLDWGFPEKYDKYFVGTPETLITDYSTQRWLYCKKDRKIKK